MKQCVRAPQQPCRRRGAIDDVQERHEVECPHSVLGWSWLQLAATHRLRDVPLPALVPLLPQTLRHLRGGLHCSHCAAERAQLVRDEPHPRPDVQGSLKARRCAGLGQQHR